MSAIMRHVFTLHGAVSTASLPVGFAQEGIAADAACMLSAGGAQLALRHELRQPFVQWLARQAANTPGGRCLACLAAVPAASRGLYSRLLFSESCWTQLLAASSSLRSSHLL